MNHCPKSEEDVEMLDVGDGERVHSPTLKTELLTLTTLETLVFDFLFTVQY